MRRIRRRRLGLGLRGLVHALALVFGLCVSGLVPTVAELAESALGDEHADSDDCGDCGDHCAPTCSDCHCAFPRALAVIPAAHEAFQFVTTVEFPTLESRTALAPDSVGIFRPPRA